MFSPRGPTNCWNSLTPISLSSAPRSRLNESFAERREHNAGSALLLSNTLYSWNSEIINAGMPLIARNEKRPSESPRQQPCSDSVTAGSNLCESSAASSCSTRGRWGCLDSLVQHRNQYVPGRFRSSLVIENSLHEGIKTVPGSSPVGWRRKPPLNDLDAMQWVKLHPRASLADILYAADKRAKFFHRVLSDTKVTMGADPETLNRILDASRARAEKARQDAQDKKDLAESCFQAHFCYCPALARAVTQAPFPAGGGH